MELITFEELFRIVYGDTICTVYDEEHENIIILRKKADAIRKENPDIFNNLVVGIEPNGKELNIMMYNPRRCTGFYIGE